MMVGDVGSAPLDGPGASAHFPDAAALRTAVMGSKVHDDTMRDSLHQSRRRGSAYWIAAEICAGGAGPPPV